MAAATTTSSLSPGKETAPLRVVKVKTTLPVSPLPPLSTRRPIETERLVLIPITQAHLGEYHILRSKPENMANSSQGRADRDTADTQKWLDRFVPPNDGATYAFVIKEKKKAVRTGAPAGGSPEDDHIIDGDSISSVAGEGPALGMMGIVRMNKGLGWPEVGYRLHPTHHGRGLATELLRAVLEFWWSLPREEVTVEMEPRYVFPSRKAGTRGDNIDNGGDVEGGEKQEEEEDDDHNDEEGEVIVEMREHVMAVGDTNNLASLRVMEKAGFTKFGEWFEEVRPSVGVTGSWLERPNQESHNKGSLEARFCV